MPAFPTEVLPTHTPTLFATAVQRATELLRAGEVVALPTETVYGLAANGWDARAVGRIFEVKCRPAHNPLILHVASMQLARQCVGAWPAPADQLAAAFWPGPLTLVLPRAASIPESVTAGGTTVGVRWPVHPFIQAVIRECGFPLAAPSANPFNRVSPTMASHVLEALDGKIPLIVDGGPCQVGIESTVLDLTARPPQVLRPGIIHAESLRAVLAADQQDVEEQEQPEHRQEHTTAAPPLASPSPGPGEILRSPGRLDRHYSPRARLVVLPWRDADDLRRQLLARGISPAGCRILAHGQIPCGKDFGGISVIPHDAEAYARALYAELHRCDSEGAECIVVEALPDGPGWDAIADRLRRAAGGL